MGRSRRARANRWTGSMLVRGGGHNLQVVRMHTWLAGCGWLVMNSNARRGGGGVRFLTTPSVPTGMGISLEYDTVLAVDIIAMVGHQNTTLTFTAITDMLRIICLAILPTYVPTVYRVHIVLVVHGL